MGHLVTCLWTVLPVPEWWLSSEGHISMEGVATVAEHTGRPGGTAGPVLPFAS